MAKRLLRTLRRPPKNIRAAAIDMSKEEARLLVREFYSWLKLSMATREHCRILKKRNMSADVVDFIRRDSINLRVHISEILDIWSEQFPAAKWAKDNIKGIGPTIAGGLAAYVDIDRCKSISSLWKFAGLSPGSRVPPVKYLDELFLEAEQNFGTEITTRHVEWLAKRLKLKPSSLIKLSEHKDGKLTWRGVQMAVRVPSYSKTLKRVCNSIGDCFIKHKSVYQDLFTYRRRYEEKRNSAGAYAKQAAEQLRKFEYRTNTRAYKAYSEGKLPPAHLVARAKRWAVKAFAAHYYMIEYYVRYKEMPPDVYALDILQGHRKIHIPAVEEVLLLNAPANQR